MENPFEILSVFDLSGISRETKIKQFLCRGQLIPLH